MTPLVRSRRSPDLSLIILVVSLLGSALFIHSRAYSSNDASRLAAIESLVQRGAWIIDESSFATVDKIKVSDHFYSDKPPLLSLAGAGVYAVLHNAFGLTLQPWGCTPERVPTWCLAVLESSEADWAYFILTLLLIDLPAALILVLMYRLAWQRGFGNAAAIGLTLVLGAGTAVWSYSTVFNNHVPAAAIYVLYFVLSTDNFGGYAYSPRWLLNPVPVLALFSVTEPALYRPRWKSVEFGVLTVISILSGFYGALNPWNPALPPLRLAYTAPAPVSPPAVAMSGYSSYSEVPADLRVMIGANNVVPRRFDARRGWVIMNGPGWYLIDNAARPIAPALVGPLGLGVTGTLALRADFTPQVAGWLNTFQPSAAIFGGDLTLIGQRIDRAGDDLSVITSWQIAVTPQPYDQRRILIELIDPAGQVVQRNEAMAARYDSLRPGDRLLQVQSLPLNDLPPGKHRLQISVVNPETGEQLSLPDGSAKTSLGEVER
jgi:hypothetical protein